MTDSQSNKLDMYTVVQDFYTTNQLTIDTVPALTTAYTALSDLVTAINTEVAGQSASSKRVTADKSILRETLDNTTLAVMAPAKAWALANGNNTLAEEFDYPLSEIQRIKDDTMEGFCTLRIGLVNDNILGMADYGLTPAQVTDWQTALDNYVAVLGAPREAINKRHLHTESLKELFSNGSLLFKSQLDPLMIPFKTSDPLLYNGYKQARIIIDRGGQKTEPGPGIPPATLFGVISDAVGGFGISGASIFTSPSAEPVLSEPSGAYRIEGLAAGEYQIHIEAVNYDSYDDTVTLEEAAEFELNAQLNPTPPAP